MLSGVSQELLLEEVEVCGMHDGDKIGQSAFGALVRTKNKNSVNPFPRGQAHIKKAYALAVHFSYNNRQQDLTDFGNVIPNQPTSKLQVDLNGTRVAAQHNLLFSELRMNRLLKTCMASKPRTIANPLVETKWSCISKVEGILNITKWCTSLMQYEQLYTPSFGQVSKYNLCIKHVNYALLTLRYF